MRTSGDSTLRRLALKNSISGSCRTSELFNEDAQTKNEELKQPLYAEYRADELFLVRPERNTRVFKCLKHQSRVVPLWWIRKKFTEWLHKRHLESFAAGLDLDLEEKVLSEELVNRAFSCFMEMKMNPD